MKRIANECFFAWVESEIKSGRSVKFRVKGNSMMPLLRNGKDEVVVGPYDKEELKLFDVILFRQTDRYVLHRIIQKRGSRYLMQGDGVCRFYEECEDTDIIGVVRRVCRPSGKKIETDSACWRLESRLWLGLGGCRGMVLRVLNRLGCCLLFLSGRPGNYFFFLCRFRDLVQRFVNNYTNRVGCGFECSWYKKRRRSGLR